MNVAHLQQHLADLGKLLDASGAGKAVVADLEALSDRLTMFRDLSLRSFADFLAKAEEAVRKGEALAPPGRKAAAPKAKPPAVEIDAVAREVASLYDRAASPDVSDEQVDRSLAALDGLKKPELVVVAERMRIPLKKSETAANIVKTIRFWITDRRGKSLRAVL